MGDNLEKLYEKYNILSDAKEKIAEHSGEYVDSIKGIKGTENEKMLAAQILSKFFKHFPDIQERALNALLDLCEDDECRIRACAMRYLVQLCKDCKEHVAKVTDIFAQMMQLDEPRDIATASWCILQLYKDEPVTTVKAIYHYIHTLADRQSREKCLNFIHKKLFRVVDEPASREELEAVIAEESKKIFDIANDISCDEFRLLFDAVWRSSFGRTAEGQKYLIDLAANTINVDRPIYKITENDINRVIACGFCALPLFSAKNDSNRFIAYICEQILPKFEFVRTLHNSEQIQLVRIMAELTTHCTKLDNASLCARHLLDILKLYLPLPPDDDTVDINRMPNFEFSIVESLLFSFHRLARQCPEFLTEDPQLLKDFRARLMYFSRGIQGCIKAIANNSTSGGNILAPRSNLLRTVTNEEDLHKLNVAPELLNNLNLLIKDLFYQPPVYKCNVKLSLKLAIPQIDTKSNTTSQTTPPKTSAAASTIQKRHAPITFDGGNEDSGSSSANKVGRKSGDPLKLYTPPSGKFSSSLPSSDRNNRTSAGNNRNRGRGKNWNRTWRN